MIVIHAGLQHHDGTSHIGGNAGAAYSEAEAAGLMETCKRTAPGQIHRSPPFPRLHLAGKSKARLPDSKYPTTLSIL